MDLNGINADHMTRLEITPRSYKEVLNCTGRIRIGYKTACNQFNILVIYFYKTTLQHCHKYLYFRNPSTIFPNYFGLKKPIL